MKKTILTSLSLIALVGSGVAQDTAVATTAPDEASAWSLTPSADLVSSYVWRGQHLAGASFQPSIAVAYKGLSLAAWGSTDFSNALNEFDLVLTYEKGGLTACVTDYFFPSNGFDLLSTTETGGYFTYDKELTGHQIEASLSYDFSNISRLPLTLACNTIVGGADLRDNGDRMFSTYIELAYDKEIGDIDLSIAAGFTPTESMYQRGTSFNMVNLTVAAAYNLQLTERWTLPLFVSATLNPNTENVYLAFGISF